MSYDNHERELMQVKLIALDLDGTALSSKRELTKRTRTAIENAIKKSVHVVIATGRAHSALPVEVFGVDGMNYLITSNGAIITDIRTDEIIYSNCIDVKALEDTISLLRNYNFMLEVFIKGYAYVDKKIYDKVSDMNLKQHHKDYIIETRKPIENLLDFALMHKELVENINVNFEYQNDRSMMRQVLGTLKNVTVTTSFDHNLEIGGATTSKADAIKFLCDKYGISQSEVMACGDSPNDMAMLKFSGIPVAMGNAKGEVKEIAKYVSSTNDEDGVAEAIERFVLC